MKRLAILACLAVVLIQNKADDNHFGKQGQKNAQASQDKSVSSTPSASGFHSADQKPSGDANKNQSQPVSITSIPKIAVQPDEDWIMIGCTVILTIVGVVGTCAAVKTLHAIVIQAHYMRVHARHLDKIAKAIRDNAITAQETANTAQKSIDLVINKERARIRIVKPEKPSLNQGSISTVDFKLIFFGTTPAYEVNSKISTVVSDSRDSLEPYMPHKITELANVVTGTDIKSSYRDFLVKPLILDEKTLAAINQKEKFIHFSGIISYNDFMGKTRETAFHYRWNPADTSGNSVRSMYSPEGWEEVGGEKENYYT